MLLPGARKHVNGLYNVVQAADGHAAGCPSLLFTSFLVEDQGLLGPPPPARSWTTPAAQSFYKNFLFLASSSTGRRIIRSAIMFLLHQQQLPPEPDGKQAPDKAVPREDSCGRWTAPGFFPRNNASRSLFCRRRTMSDQKTTRKNSKNAASVGATAGASAGSRKSLQLLLQMLARRPMKIMSTCWSCWSIYKVVLDVTFSDSVQPAPGAAFALQVVNRVDQHQASSLLKTSHHHAEKNDKKEKIRAASASGVKNGIKKNVKGKKVVNEQSTSTNEIEVSKKSTTDADQHSTKTSSVSSLPQKDKKVEGGSMFFTYKNTGPGSLDHDTVFQYVENPNWDLKPESGGPLRYTSSDVDPSAIPGVPDTNFVGMKQIPWAKSDTNRESTWRRIPLKEKPFSDPNTNNDEPAPYDKMYYENKPDVPACPLNRQAAFTLQSADPARDFYLQVQWGPETKSKNEDKNDLCRTVAYRGDIATELEVDQQRATIVKRVCDVKILRDTTRQDLPHWYSNSSDADVAHPDATPFFIKHTMERTEQLDCMEPGVVLNTNPPDYGCANRTAKWVQLEVAEGDTYDLTYEGPSHTGWCLGTEIFTNSSRPLEPPEEYLVVYNNYCDYRTSQWFELVHYPNSPDIYTLRLRYTDTPPVRPSPFDSDNRQSDTGQVDDQMWYKGDGKGFWLRRRGNPTLADYNSDQFRLRLFDTNCTMPNFDAKNDTAYY
ncbi:unnamed protein product [Amoebophrya sp. A120]|nr:unnamed protein product [Amoebophrya sp. A120]|eukprot:GSA120T00000290001.1